MREDLERFNRWAPTYDRSVWQWLVFKPVHRAMRAALAPKPDETVLDVGCGTGNLALLVGGSCRRLVGVDPAVAMAAEADRKRGQLPLSFAAAAAEALPFPTGSFDSAVSAISAHHWTEPSRGFAELARVLRPGARLVIADQGRTGWVSRLMRRLRKGAPHHHTGWHTSELGDLLYGAGFSTVRARELRGIARGGTVVLLVAQR